MSRVSVVRMWCSFDLSRLYKQNGFSLAISHGYHTDILFFSIAMYNIDFSYSNDVNFKIL